MILEHNPHRFKLLSTLIISFVICAAALSGQTCDKRTAIFFDTDEYAISETEALKLNKLAKIFSLKTDTFFLEVDAFTDSIASVEHNYKLARNRSKAVLKYLRKNSSAHFEVKERVRGEAMPLRSNATDEGRAKNRRVDIFYWKLKEGRITIKGKGGTEIEIKKDFFGPCGICESRPTMTELFTNEQAEKAGVSMGTTDGEQLITGGMMKLDLTCSGLPNRCTDVVIRIPSASYNENMEIWKASNTSLPGAWSNDPKGELEYDEKEKCYIMRVNYCPGDMINADVKVVSHAFPMGLIVTPELTRKRNASFQFVPNFQRLSYKGNEATSLLGFSYETKGTRFIVDSGVTKTKIGYVFKGSIDKYEAECDSFCSKRNLCWCFEIPREAYTKIIYFQKRKKVRVKIPLKFKNFTPQLYIPAADTLLPLTRLKGSKRKYIFQQPLPDTYVVIYNEKANLQNKRGFDAEVDVATLKARYSKRKKYYKARLTRKQLKKAKPKKAS